MKNFKIKKLLVIIILLFTFFIPVSNGQTISIKGGLNISEIYEKYRELVREYEVLHGPHIAMNVDFKILNKLYFESGLKLSEKGYRIFGDDYLFKDHITGFKVSLYYLEVPFVIKKVNQISSKTNQYFLFGAYFGIGISGKTKVTYSDSGKEKVESTKISWGKDLNSGDMGARIGIGWEFGTFITEISYEFGLVNILPDTWEHQKHKNMSLSVSIGIKLGKD